jgi:tryptophan-rich sensory protein
MALAPDPRLAVATALGVAAAWLASLMLDFRDGRTVTRPPVQPRDAAFGIWAVIFPLLGATALAAGDPNAHPPRAVLAALGALALCVAWAFAFRNRARALAAASLVGAAALAWLASVWAKAPWVAQSLALFAGWLGVASQLGLALAGASAFGTPAALAGAAAATSALAIGLARPAAAAAVLWAAALQRERTAGGALALALAGVAGGAWRAAAH